MRLTYKQLKEAFLTECNRVANLQLGKVFFQDYEIAHYLNAGYMSRVNARLGLFDERYISSDHRLTGIQKQQEVPFPASMRVLLDFGDLYFSSGLIKDTGIYLDGRDIAACGQFTKIFKVPTTYRKVDCATRKTEDKETVLLETPYLVNVNIHEYKLVPDPNDSSKKVWQRCHTQLCRPVNPVDVTRMTLLYQDDKYMPYTYYRVRPIFHGAIEEKKDGTVTTITTVPKMEMVVEASYEPRNTGVEIFMTADMIRFPEPITKEQIAEESSDILEVMFGYEIAQAGATLAMEAVGAGRVQSMAQAVSSSMPQ